MAEPEPVKEYVWEPIAPLTRIGVILEKGVVIISHQFPPEYEAVIANRFVNITQGFVCTSVSLLATDALALATLIKAHVPVPEEPPSGSTFDLAAADLNEDGTTVVVVTMRPLTTKERRQSKSPQTFTIEKGDGICRVLLVVPFTKAHKIARAIEDIATTITRRLAEHFPEPPK